MNYHNLIWTYFYKEGNNWKKIRVHKIVNNKIAANIYTNIISFTFKSVKIMQFKKIEGLKNIIYIYIFN